MKTKMFKATIEEGVPLRKNETNQFAWRLRRYLEERIVGLKVESISFLLFNGDKVLKTYVKKERRKDNTVVDVFEDIGGPEIRLYVNDFHIATWMLNCDRLTTDMLDKNFYEFAQVALLAIIGTWEFRNVRICCTKWNGLWGAPKGATIECCINS